MRKQLPSFHSWKNSNSLVLFMYRCILHSHFDWYLLPFQDCFMNYTQFCIHMAFPVSLRLLSDHVTTDWVHSTTCIDNSMSKKCFVLSLTTKKLLDMWTWNHIMLNFELLSIVIDLSDLCFLSHTLLYIASILSRNCHSYYRSKVQIPPVIPRIWKTHVVWGF